MTRQEGIWRRKRGNGEEGIGIRKGWNRVEERRV